MNRINKEQLIKSMCKLVSSLCSYTRQPCDCKFIQDNDQNIASGSENGSGCPEITMAAILLSYMTNQEFLVLAKRANIGISEDCEIPTPDVFGMIRKFQDERMEKWRANAIANTTPKKVTKKVNRKSAYVSGKLPKGIL